MLHSRDRGCTKPGCTVPGYGTQVHHVNGWATGGQTNIDKEVLACGADNRLAERLLAQEDQEGAGQIDPGMPVPIDGVTMGGGAMTGGATMGGGEMTGGGATGGGEMIGGGAIGGGGGGGMSGASAGGGGGTDGGASGPKQFGSSGWMAHDGSAGSVAGT